MSPFFFYVSKRVKQVDLKIVIFTTAYYTFYISVVTHIESDIMPERIRIIFKNLRDFSNKIIECDEKHALETAAKTCLDGYVIEKSEVIADESTLTSILSDLTVH
jgi:hypothetical protein